MSSSRAEFLNRVRTAIEQSRRPGANPAAPERGIIGYQGGGSDHVHTFREALLASGANFHRVRDRETVVTTVVGLLQQRGVRKVLLGKGATLDALPLADRLSSDGFEVFNTETTREAQFAADASITGVDGLLAETGSIVTRTSPTEPRLLTLAPPVHIAVADETQIIPDMFDLFAEDARERMPSCLTLITGPSKTGDIELKLVTGVHGPGEVHVVLIAKDLV